MADSGDGTDARTQLLVVLAAFGLLLMAFGLMYNPQPQYTYTISEPDADEAAELEAVAFEELSAEAQDGFTAALEDSNGTATRFGEEQRPADLLEADSTAHLVEHEGEQYRLEVTAREGFIRTTSFNPFLLLGGILFGFSALRAWRRSRE